MNFLYPKLPPGRVFAMLRVALLGALLAGGYGAVHDQISYAISPEYFTKLKFRQFAYADFGLPPRAFASVIGFLGTWWVGLFAGWFLARVGLTELPAGEQRRCTVRAFALVATAAPTAGVVGAALGVFVTQNGVPPSWEDWRFLGVDDLRGFVIVAYLHAAGYIGALLGLVAAVLYVRNRWTRFRAAEVSKTK